ncbi:carbon storage regulator [Metapseudomonas furukawaii]|uniref:carbon storage regulator n=1 Tax=Metapseudomonas furukawaii TaxID=1149133 RepID=UPI0002AC03BA|nr:carbon storage regulator [Pseudomonas furukawaii]ELS25351.1 hypothetical protein ppKF707_2254 [Pseudomonas furukawaii]ELS27563.1 hypothetical protein ppKF707_4935 [Pseudomonas furukawaii]
MDRNGNLVLGRKAGQSIRISLKDTDLGSAEEVLASLLSDGIVVELSEVYDGSARLRVSAHRGLTILRTELEG